LPITPSDIIRRMKYTMSEKEPPRPLAGATAERTVNPLAGAELM
jgi:hypothetical protein